MESIKAVWNKINRVDDPVQNVAKFIFSNDTSVAEAVLYKYPTYAERTVICCSTQSGCPVGCRFCGAGDHFVRSLSADEIFSQPGYLLDQIDVHPDEIGRLQIMFMSMGEPLLNIHALSAAIERLAEEYPSAALLISTSAPRVNYKPIRELSRKVPTVGLQFSVHESTDAARNLLIPFKAKLCLAEIADEGENWFDATGRNPFFNYCAHDGNETDDDADRIRDLFNPAVFKATVSVVCERSDGLPATNQHQRDLATSFAGRLVARGFDVRVFDPAGQDTIGGGCGQLWFVQDWMQQHPDKVRPSIGHGLPEVHAPSLAATPSQSEPHDEIKDLAFKTAAHGLGELMQENATLQARVKELEAQLATARQSLKDQASARLDPTMPLLKPDVLEKIREWAEASYAMAESQEERIEAHGLSLLCDWQDRAREAKGTAALSKEAGR